MSCVERLNPVACIENGIRGVIHLGENSVRYAASSVCSLGGRAISTFATLIRDPGGFKSVCLLVTGVLEAVQLYGSTVRLDKLVTDCKVASEIITASSIVSRTSDFISGKAYKTQNDLDPIKLASNLSFLFYDLFGMLKWTEKVELTPAGGANALSQGILGASQDVGRSFFGYMGCGFSIVETALLVKQEYSQNGLSRNLINKNTFFSVAINTSRIIGFWAPKGSAVSIGSGICAAALSIARTLLSETPR